MALIRDAMTGKNYERWLRDLPLVKEEQPVKEDPVPPVVPEQLKEIPSGEIKDVGCRRRNIRNDEGQIFCGYDVYVLFENGKSVEGWLPEAYFEQLKRRIPQERSDLLKKVSL